jgi:hypothetical protein
MDDAAVKDFESAYPWIPWREPLALPVVKGAPERYACRFCVAISGLRDGEPQSLPTDPEVVRHHIERVHPRPVAGQLLDWPTYRIL